MNGSDTGGGQAARRANGVNRVTGGLTTFTPNGTPIPQQKRVATNSFAFGQFEPDCHTCFRSEDYELIIPKTDRIGGDIRLSYEITPHLEFDVDEKLIQREIYDFNQPSISFATVVRRTTRSSRQQYARSTRLH